MAVALPNAVLPVKLIDMFHKDLKIQAKGTKGGAYKARISELTTFIMNDASYIVPLVYARSKMTLDGMKDPEIVKYNKAKTQFRDTKYCKQKPIFDEAMEFLRKTGSVFLQLYCGNGKTFLALTIAANLGLKAIILAHRRFLCRQFMTEGETVIPGQMRWIDDNDVSIDTTGSIFVCTPQRALKLPEEFTSTINFMIVDEAKYWCTPERIAAMLVFRPTHTMGLCAERTRKDGYHIVLDQFFGHNIFRKSCKPFIVWKYITAFKPIIKKPDYGKAKIDWTIAMRSLSRMQERNEMIRDICLLRKDNKIMILVQYQEHVETLEAMLKAAGEKVGTFYKSDESYMNCRILIATYSKAEMGFDDKNLCENFDGNRLDLLILGAFYKKEIEQSAGRVMRSDAPEVIDIEDDLPSLQKHSITRTKWFKSRNGKVMPNEYFFNIRKKRK